MPHTPLLLSQEACRTRRDRFVAALDALPVHQAVIVSPENIQYLTGFRPHRLLCAALAFDRRNGWALAAPNEVPPHVEIDRVVTFPAQRMATLRQDQPLAACNALADAGCTIKRSVGLEFSACAPALPSINDGALTDIDPVLRQLRRRKDPDEIAMIRRAVACTDAMYAAAREVIAPGVTELAVFNRLHAAAVDTAGEPLNALGNDYQCNSPGGPPRPRAVQSGELYILDLGPSYRGYYADNCRTFSVDGRPTDLQHAAWERIVAVLEMVERTVKPGVSCRSVYETAAEMLTAADVGEFPHHLGHGFGLYPHETPHLNPNWDDVFEEGDCFTAEPGLYAPELRAGIRLEQDYLVTAAGVERLTHFPLEL